MALDKNLVVLVNERDEETGSMEKMEAHHTGALHRAFSVFILNDKGEMLLQQRAMEKYHSGGLWSNACCSHPFIGEDVEAAAHRRLQEELGFDTELKKMFVFRYNSDVGGGLVENEMDHIFIGDYSSRVKCNPAEVMGAEFLSITSIRTWLAESPGDFTAWFRLAFPEFLEHLQQQQEVR